MNWLIAYLLVNLLATVALRLTDDRKWPLLEFVLGAMFALPVLLAVGTIIVLSKRV